MVKLGKVYGNLMVDVKPSNESSCIAAFPSCAKQPEQTKRLL